MVCGYDNIAGEKVFEKFQDNDVLRLRQFCTRKVFECFQDNDELRRNNFAGEKTFECFQDNDDLRPRQSCRLKIL